MPSVNRNHKRTDKFKKHLLHTGCKQVRFSPFLKLVSQVRFLPGVLFFTEFFADWAFSPFPYFTGLGLFLSPISDKTLTNFFRRNLAYQLAALFKNLGFLGA